MQLKLRTINLNGKYARTVQNLCRQSKVVKLLRHWHVTKHRDLNTIENYELLWEIVQLAYPRVSTRANGTSSQSRRTVVSHQLRSQVEVERNTTRVVRERRDLTRRKSWIWESTVHRNMEVPRCGGCAAKLSKDCITTYWINQFCPQLHEETKVPED